MLIGLAIGIFTSRIIRPVFDLEYLETAIIAALLACIVVTIFEFIKAHKKK
jgi:preprotein translocase subunit SecD